MVFAPREFDDIIAALGTRANNLEVLTERIFAGEMKTELRSIDDGAFVADDFVENAAVFQDEFAFIAATR